MIPATYPEVRWMFGIKYLTYASALHNTREYMIPAPLHRKYIEAKYIVWGHLESNQKSQDTNSCHLIPWSTNHNQTFILGAKKYLVGNRQMTSRMQQI